MMLAGVDLPAPRGKHVGMFRSPFSDLIRHPAKNPSEEKKAG